MPSNTAPAIRGQILFFGITYLEGYRETNYTDVTEIFSGLKDREKTACSVADINHYG